MYTNVTSYALQTRTIDYYSFLPFENNSFDLPHLLYVQITLFDRRSTNCDEPMYSGRVLRIIRTVYDTCITFISKNSMTLNEEKKNV